MSSIFRHNVGYNGPDIANMISPEELAYMIAHPNQFRNFRNPNDILGNSLGNHTKTAIYVDVDGSKMMSFISYVLMHPHLLPPSKEKLLYQYFDNNHALSTWTFKDGQVIDKDGNKVVAVNYQSLQATVLEKMNDDLEKWMALDRILAAGGYSANEEIYLDSLKAHIVADGLGSSAELAHEEIVKQSQSARKEAEELYQSLGDVPWGFALSSDEVRAAYAAGGVDYQATVGSMSSRCQEKEEISSRILTDFQELKTQLKAGIDKKIQEDATLAQEIAGW